MNMHVAPSDLSQLFDQSGCRKYLCDTEMARYLAVVGQRDAITQAFCLLLAHSGCRISEALAVTTLNLDREAKRVIFRTLKRRRTVFRAVPVPDELMAQLLAIAAMHEGDDARLWPWSRQTAWRKIKSVMDAANIDGAMAMPKGLRHAYGIRAAGHNVPANLIQRWLGHAKPSTTALYLDAVGNEERAFAKRMW
ncbi:MAG: site-specific integrase [Pseudomonadota bacterium]